jgi:hypothetical protein
MVDVSNQTIAEDGAEVKGNIYPFPFRGERVNFLLSQEDAMADDRRPDIVDYRI